MIHEWLTSLPIAHRGLHSGDSRVPENSLAAFKEAVAQGYAIECDIHLLADGGIAVFHDDDLQRMCGAAIAIGSLTTPQLKEYRLYASDQQIPTLEEVLELVHGTVPLLIEIKATNSNIAIQKALAKVLMHYDGAVAIQSFYPFTLNLLQQLLPHVPRGQLSGSYRNEKGNLLLQWLLRHYAFNFICKPDFIAHEAKDIIHNATVRRLRRKGMPVLCWTVRNADQWNVVQGYCDNIIFEGFVP